MKQLDQPEQQPLESEPNARPAGRRWLLWIVVTLLVLLLAVPLLAPHYLASSSCKAIIQQIFTEQTGGQLDYQVLDLSYWPRPSLELQQVELEIPEKVKGRIAALYLSPDLLPLLNGQLQLARLELKAPDLALTLAAKKQAEAPASSPGLTELENSLAEGLELLAQSIPNLDLLIDSGSLLVSQGGPPLVDLEGLNLQLELAVSDSREAQVTLQTGFSGLNIHHDDQRQSIQGVELTGGAQLADGVISVALEQLAVDSPALELDGTLSLNPAAPEIKLSISGRNIDVDAARKTAVALAGDITPVKEIFTYLRGGRVVQISVTSQGATPADLGEFDNLRIEGKLQNGEVAIPEIDLVLSEVKGDVLVSKGVLQGSEMSTRLEGSSARDGKLKVALAPGNHLFQLELTLAADLKQTAPILKRVVDSPDFVAELEKLDVIEGVGHGRLVLGDSLTDVNATVEISDFNLTADYGRLPVPIKILRGQLTFNQGQVAFGKISGTLGSSSFNDVSGRVDWADKVSLEIRSGRFGLLLDRIYPWLNTFEELSEKLSEVSRLTGRLELSSLQFSGLLEQPDSWQYAANGSLQELAVDTSLFPGTLRVDSGNLQISEKQLAFQQLKTRGLDAELTLSGTLTGISQPLERFELAPVGQLGPAAVDWLSARLEVPPNYQVHSPLQIHNAQIAWQPDGTAAVVGRVSIDAGPEITADVDYRPQLLEVRQLTIRDQYSDARIEATLAEDHSDLKFTGQLQHTTLLDLFLERKLRSGRIEGELSLSIPLERHFKATAVGQLSGKNLVALLENGEKLAIDQLSLDAAGAQGKVDITRLNYAGLTWEPVHAKLQFVDDRTEIRLDRAQLCGINSPGTISYNGEEFSLDFDLEEKGLDLVSSYSCLTEGRVRLTGSLDFSSQVRSQGPAGDLLRNMSGPLKMTFRKGTIEQSPMLARVLEVLNVTEIFKGRLPNLSQTSLPYKKASLVGNFKDGKLLVESFELDGETIGILGDGEIDLLQETYDLELMAAPFRTVDRIVRFIPGVNYLLAGSLVAIPVRVEGALTNPDVSVMSVTSVGKSLLRLGGRILKSPIKLIETITPESKEKAQE